ncbi:MAG TPA: SPOR domain-containing protein [Gemmatimonadaceae bacterium]
MTLPKISIAGRGYTRALPAGLTLMRRGFIRALLAGLALMRRGFIRALLAGLALMRRGLIRALLAGLALPVLAGAQSTRDSSLYLQAQQMVANGDAPGGRRLADSVGAAAPTGSPAYAEGLYWRAALAANARDSEQQYRQIIVDYPLSGRVPDALLRLGQLESARGENAAALQHFQRIVLEHPESSLHAEASYWVAHMYFDTNDATRACTANADALASVRPSNIELKNRIDFQQQRCSGVGVALTTNTAETPVTVPVKAAPTVEPPKATPTVEPPKATPAVEPPKVTPKREITARDTKDHSDTNAKRVVDAVTPSDARSTGSGVVSRPPTEEEVARALASAKQPIASQALKTKTSKAASHVPSRHTSAPVRVSDESTARGASYAVQVAAFGTKAPATLLVAKLRGRGYNAYIDGTSAPYRVRIGHYASHAEAAAELAELKAKQIDGFVAER